MPRKIVRQVGFIYKIIQGCGSTKHKIHLEDLIFHIGSPGCDICRRRELSWYLSSCT